MDHQHAEKPQKRSDTSARTSSTSSDPAITSGQPSAEQILALQRLIGNRAVNNLLQRSGKPPVSAGKAPAHVIQRAWAVGTRIEREFCGWGTVTGVSPSGLYMIRWDSPMAALMTSLYPPSIEEDDSRVLQVVAPGQQPVQNAQNDQDEDDQSEDEAPTHDRFGNNIVKTQFESKLAAYINNDPLVRGVVTIVSDAIQELLGEVIVATLQSEKEVKAGSHRGVARRVGEAMGKYMYSTGGTFGSIGTAPSQSGPYHDVMRAIQGGYGNIQSMMLAQQSYLFNILLPFQDGGGISRYLDQLKPPEQERGRRKDPQARQQRGMAPTIGILEDVTEGEELAEDLGAKNLLPHTRTQDSTRPDENHPVVKAMRRLDMPFVGGLSGSAADLITVALHVGGLKGDNLRLYTLGVIGYLVGGGMHSVHEIMMVASRAGVPYTAGDYNSIFPDSFRRSSVYMLLAQEFPGLINPPAQTGMILTTWRRGKGF